MVFGSALALLKDGKKVYRSGWNGKGAWLAMVAGKNWGNWGMILTPSHMNIIQHTRHLLG